MHPEHRSIGELAYSLWQARGCPEGSAERDWLDAEMQLKGAQRTIEPRAAEPRAVAPRADEPPANADAKWKAAASRKASAATRPRQPKSTQSKPGAKPPG